MTAKYFRYVSATTLDVSTLYATAVTKHCVEHISLQASENTTQITFPAAFARHISARTTHTTNTMASFIAIFTTRPASLRSAVDATWPFLSNTSKLTAWM